MKEKGRVKTAACIAHILCMLFAAAAFEVFFVLSVNRLTAEWGATLCLAVLAVGSLLNAALLAADLVFYFLRIELGYKTCITVYVTAVFFAVVLYVLVATGFLEIMRDEASLESYLERSGAWMGVLFTVLQFLQVVILPIPSSVTVAAGSFLFGALWGSLYSLLGIFLGSLVAFLVGRYAGSRVVAWLIGKETLDKWLKKIKGKDKLLLSAMFLLPVFPDDVLCFVAGISSMSLWFFLAVIFISRVLAIFTTSWFVSLIPFDTWWGILIWCILGVLVAALFVVLYKKSDAILGWFERRFHRETRVEEKPKAGEFTLEVVDPDGSIVKKGVRKEGADDEPPAPPK